MEGMCAIKYRSVSKSMWRSLGGLALCLQMGGVVLGTPAFVQERDNQINSGQRNSVTFSAATTSGNLLVAYLIWDSTGSASVSDSLGNTYTGAIAPIRWSNGAYSAQIFYAVSQRSGTATVTATFSNRVQLFGIVYAHEYRGVSQTSPIDVTAAAAGASGSLNSGSVATSNSSDLIFAGGVSANAIMACGPGYTARSTAQGNMTEDKTVSVTGAYNATASNSGGAWAMQMVAFKGSSSGVSDTTPPSVPTGLSAAGASSAQINLSWSASADPENSAGQLTYGVFRNGSRIATTAAGSTVWADTGLAASTTYSYTICAYDPAGNGSAQSTAVRAATKAANTSNGSPDTQPPSVSIASPGNNQSVSGVTSVAANASDNTGVASVQFQIDGANLGVQLTSSPYSAVWNTAQSANGSHVLTAIAVDAAGNRAVSSGVTVTVNNSSGRTYTTNFPLTENPISEGGSWINGETTGLDWAGVQTTGGIVEGVGPANAAYSDPTAILAGNWGPNQTVTATVYSNGVEDKPGQGYDKEVEIRLRSSISAHSITGYEINCRTPNDSYSYMAIVRWNGALGNFTVLNILYGTGCGNGDIFKATISGSTISAYRNGVLMLTANDGTFTTGNPGLGFNFGCGSAYNQFGFTSYTATDGSGNGSGNTSDTAPPSSPANLSAMVVSSSQINLTWSASTDNVGVAGYRVYRNGTQVGTTAAASYNDTGLAASTTFTYTVAAYDASGNVSAQSTQLLVTTAAPAMMPPAFVQVSHNQIPAGSSTPVNLGVATQPGNTIVVYVIWNNSGAAAVTDSAGDLFQSVSAPVSWGRGYCAQIFYATNIAGGASTVTATFQTPVTSFGVVYAHEYSGISATNPVDVTVSASGSSTSLNSGSATTTSANDLIFGAAVSDNAVTGAGSGFVSRDLAYGNITEDRNGAAIGSYAATATHNGQQWGIQMVAFRAAQ
jgi:chitodextrinase